MTTWNEIPFDPNATPEEKADQFDRQITENGGTPPASAPPEDGDNE